MYIYICIYILGALGRRCVRVQPLRRSSRRCPTSQRKRRSAQWLQPPTPSQVGFGPENVSTQSILVYRVVVGELKFVGSRDTLADHVEWLSWYGGSRKFVSREVLRSSSDMECWYPPTVYQKGHPGQRFTIRQARDHTDCLIVHHDA